MGVLSISLSLLVQADKFWNSNFTFAFNNAATGAGFWATMLTTGGVCMCVRVRVCFVLEVSENGWVRA